MEETQLEMKCPKCGNDMKEYATCFRCRYLECRYTYRKVFQPDLSIQLKPVVQTVIEDPAIARLIIEHQAHGPTPEEIEKIRANDWLWKDFPIPTLG